MRLASGLLAACAVALAASAELPKRAELERRCGKGELSACSNLGVEVERGLDGPKDEARAAGLFARACAGHVGSGCYNLGTRYQRGAGVPRDWAKAAGYFLDACDHGHARACSSAADLNDQGGPGLPKDQAQAAKLYGRACDAGYHNGCYNLGTSYQSGEGVAADPFRALSLYLRACYAEVEPEPPACNNAGHMLVRGDGVPVDKVKGALHLARMCSLAQASSATAETRRAALLACVTAARLYQGGDVVPAAPAKAKELYAGACKLGYGPACEAAEQIK